MEGQTVNSFRDLNITNILFLLQLNFENQFHTNKLMQTILNTKVIRHTIMILSNFHVFFQLKIYYPTQEFLKIFTTQQFFNPQVVPPLLYIIHGFALHGILWEFNRYDIIK